MNKTTAFLLAAALLSRGPAVHAQVWQPSAGHVQTAIWPGTVPDAIANPKPESVGPPKGRQWWPRANDDDHTDGVEQSLAYYVALNEAGVPTEMHLYAQGGHAFGLRRGKLPIAQWPKLVETWLETIGMTGAVQSR